MTVKSSIVRLRRLRSSGATRTLLAKAKPQSTNMVWPVVVVEGSNVKQEVPSMPGQHLLSPDRLVEEIRSLAVPIGGILLFGKIDNKRKTEDARYSWDSSGLLQKSIAIVKKTFPDLMVMSDVGLSGYTSHGNSGILNAKSKQIDNDETLSALSRIALSHADAGADCVAPSCMMDGQVDQIRRTLEENRFVETLVMGYSAKFSSNLYDTFPVWMSGASEETAGSFRNSCPLMESYCLPYDSKELACREALQDELEGADILMVKPAIHYLDIISEIRQRTQLPLAAYNVSGEYSMIHATAERGWGDLYRLARESLVAINRAGADITITYWANQFSHIFP
ncbi:Delta-aminolevulinic acid dehydratase [Pirellula sp. SH-Sr6A]|uniref:porphobilinogen synthase n=1 Tax=Pirellula sp. SH-Sr6A TaxID=1632865 RepID=UPI00078BF638|nr:porphobilinogen synthase [Pirellula sp. SH-Sr6A]AMV35337.1 Delta-aminolevulinic acid dehydratase [Pirellula sp. SH-Sr6A]